MLLEPGFQLAGHTSPCLSAHTIESQDHYLVRMLYLRANFCWQLNHGGMGQGTGGSVGSTSELEGLDEAKGLLRTATNREIVDGDLADDSLGVDYEETAE